MDGNAALGWWIVAGVLVAGELARGTFYVLMIATGCVAAALAAHAGADVPTQMLVAAVVSGGAVAAWHVVRRRRAAAMPAPAGNRDINLDVGERVHVDAWNADGTARIRYRGADWNARFVGAGAPTPGAHVIAEMRHNELALRRPN